MTKLSERVPDPSPVSLQEWRARLRGWLKELAEYVEFIDRRDQIEIHNLHKQFSGCAQGVKYKPQTYDEVIALTHWDKLKCAQEVKYEPQTYDEAIALCKGWRRSSVVGWNKPDSDDSNWVVFESHKRPRLFADDVYVESWEETKWPDLWKEMVEAKVRKLYLSEITDNKWVFNLFSVIYTDSTPGRVVCKAYLVYKGHPDWAERLSGMGAD